MAFSWTSHAITPAQATEGDPPTSNRLLFKVGSTLYYVTHAGVGISEATENIWIEKSTDGGATWTQTYNGPKATDAFAVTLVGTVIYIIGNNYPGRILNVYRYNTATDLFLADGALPGITFRWVVAAEPYTDGTILVAYVDDATFAIRCVVYNPTGDSWGTPVQVWGSPFVYPLGLVNDPAQDVMFLFGLFTTTVYCAPISKPTTVGTIVAATTAITTSISNVTVGTPVVSGGKVMIPYADPLGTSDPPALYVVSSLASTTLSFGAPQLIETGSGWPGPAPFTLDYDTLWFGWAMVDLNGTPYVFWSDNVNQQDNASSQTIIKYSSYSGGTWSAPAVAWSGPVPSSSMSLFPLAVSGTTIGVIVAYANPIEWFASRTKYASLSTVYLAGTLAGPPLAISCNNPPSGSLFIPYSHAIVVTGGTPPYSIAIISGSLPTGLTMNANGLISGTPLASGTFLFTVNATDSAAASVPVTCTIIIIAGTRRGGGLAWRYGPRYPQTERERD